MSRHSLEKSLAILAPNLTSNKKVISPTTIQLITRTLKLFKKK